MYHIVFLYFCFFAFCFFSFLFFFFSFLFFSFFPPGIKENREDKNVKVLLNGSAFSRAESKVYTGSAVCAMYSLRCLGSIT